MKKYIYFLWLLTFISFILSCKEEMKGPLMESAEIPAPLTNITVQNIPGGAKINYTLPDDPNLLYVMATFSSREGEERVVKSSVFKNYVILEGFGDTNEYIVSLYTVSRSATKSLPMTTKIQPLTPPIKTVSQTLNVFEEYGGIGINFFNENEDQLTLYTLLRDSITNNWYEYDRFYTSAKEWTHLVRGLAPDSTEFGIYFSDKFRNNSDTLFTTIKPLYEVEFDYSLFNIYPLADDVYRGRYSRDVSTLWTNSGYLWINNADYPGLTIPNWFTVDTGKRYKFGRMKLWPRPGVEGFLYARGVPKKFEIWGSNNPSNNWDDWSLIGAFEVIKPSGLPLGSLSEDDWASAEAGWDFTFPRSQESYRYFRFKLVETWAGGDPYLILQYWQFWGEPAE
jgi:hypothetical protein